jgi:protein O-mannosyl-transferase
MKEITQKDLVRIFKDNYENKSDTRFVFLLGAGASVQSGISSANTLAKKWIEEIKEDLGDNFEKWMTDKEIDKDNLAFSYTEIFQKRFEHNPKNGYEYLQKLMEGIEPSIGYSILSQILEQTNHNFVITTNFDSLIEDALFLFTSQRPLVCGHESLASFIQLNSTRPTIIKVHRDILLDPYNTPANTCSLETSFENALKPILVNSPMIILGYGGNDKSIMNLLNNNQRQAIYWCVRNTVNISPEIKEILEKNEMDRIVKIDGFDEFMVALFSNVYNFKSIKSLSEEDDTKSLIVQNALEKVQKYKKQLDSFKEEVKKSDSKDFKENSKSILPNSWDYILKADSEKDIVEKNKIYLEGMNAYKNNLELTFNYAIFLENKKKDYDTAEIYYKQCLDIDSNNSFIHGTYAIFLQNIRKDYQKAEIYYKKSLNTNSLNADLNGNYSQFLLIQNRKEESIQYLQKAFELHTTENSLLVELWFYKLAHFQEEYITTKDKLDELIMSEYKSLDWDFSQNIEQAIKENHPHIQVLKEYANKISGLDYSHIK